MRDLRVAIVVGQLSVGGTERQAAGLSVELTRRGVPTLLVSMRREIDPFSSFARNHGVTVRAVGDESRSLLARSNSLAGLLNEQKAHLIHSFGDPAGAFSTLAGAFLRLPHVHSVRGLASARPWWRRILRQVTLVRADVVTANCHAVLRDVLKLATVHPSHLVLIPNGIDLRSFDGAVIGGEGQRPWRTDTRTVLFVGRDHPSKGLDTLMGVMEATNRRARKLPFRVVFRLAGGGLEHRLGRETRALHRVEVEFLGVQIGMEQVYRECDVVILTSRSEGLPNVLIEAAAAGKPVVATRVGGCGEIVQDGKTGYLIESSDAEGISSRLIRLLSDDALRLGMGSSNRKRAVELTERGFAWEEVCRKMVSAYDLAAGNSSGSSATFALGAMDP